VLYSPSHLSALADLKYNREIAVELSRCYRYAAVSPLLRYGEIGQLSASTNLVGEDAIPSHTKLLYRQTQDAKDVVFKAPCQL
jgi:hypothetical protein